MSVSVPTGTGADKAAKNQVTKKMSSKKSKAAKADIDADADASVSGSAKCTKKSKTREK